MRLLKLAMLALFGYTIYEFLRGMLQPDDRGQYTSREGGMSTPDPNGGSTRQGVGRGVVS